MKIYHIESDLKIFGRQVKRFPDGIEEAFDELVKMLGGFNRSFYGICFMGKDGRLVYCAAAKENHEGEAEQYNCEKYIIEKGEYLAVTIHGWRKKTDTIKDVFHGLMQDERADQTKQSVEWYKNDDEMMCMVKAKTKE
ncbi:MAG: hypothetical protein SFU87_17375 [Chitinophagaceae bacterium]|nr:hypothetical protein [Chitinophagaceae bacterium]